MALMVKFVGSYPLQEMLFFRGIVAVLVFGIYYKIKGISLKPVNLPYNLLRSALGTVGVFAYYYAISQINLPNAVTLHKMNPFFVIIFSGMFLSEKIRPYQIISFIIAMIGAILVIKPTGNFELIGSLSALTSAIFAGGAYVVIRYLRSYDTPQTIVFFFSLFTVVIGLVLMLTMGYVIPPIQDLIYLIFIGVFTMLAQTLMTVAYSYASASKISIYSFAYIIFSMIFSTIFLSNTPDLLTVIGAVIIIGAATLNYKMDREITH
jgi:drug/metabolite transporter (DMT)-like permease